MLLEIGRESTSPIFRSLHFPKFQIFVEMVCANFESQVWSRHVGVELSYPLTLAVGIYVDMWTLLLLSKRLIISTKTRLSKTLLSSEKDNRLSQFYLISVAH